MSVSKSIALKSGIYVFATEKEITEVNELKQPAHYEDYKRILGDERCSIIVSSNFHEIPVFLIRSMTIIPNEDKSFKDSPDVGEDCICSRCGKPILDFAYRAFCIESNEEYRFHEDCFIM